MAQICPNNGDPSSKLLHPTIYGTFPPPPQPYPAAPERDGHHTVVVAEGLPARIAVCSPLLPLPFCGIGIGWALFVAGFFFAAIPWYFGAFIFLFIAMDEREKPGLVACSVAAILAAITALAGLSTNIPFR